MKYTKEELACLWMDSLFETDPLKYALLEVAETPFEFALHLEKFAPAMIKAGKECLYNKIRDSLSSNAYTKKSVAELEKRGLQAVTLVSPDYPEELKRLPDPPLVLYAKGDTSLLKKEKFTIVGSRHTSAAVLKAGEQMAEKLAKHFVIVSGIADGGDTAALIGAKKSGKVISVLPFGFDKVPSSRLSFVKELSENGLVITEFLHSYRPQRYSFLIRNRIMAALGRGVLALSAGEKSGVLNTCSRAADLSKEVFALPYSPGIESGKGCNQLIKNGAFLCDDASDILSLYGFPTEEPKEELPEEERIILKLLKESGELHIYELAEKTKRSTDDLLSELLLLEMDGKVVKTGGNKYSAV